MGEGYGQPHGGLHEGSKPPGRQVKGWSLSRSPGLSFSDQFCQNCNGQNSPAQHSSPSVCHAKLLNSSEGGSRGCLWSGSCLPGAGGERTFYGCLTPPQPLLTSIQSSLASSGACFSLAVGRRSLLTTIHGPISLRLWVSIPWGPMSPLLC